MKNSRKSPEKSGKYILAKAMKEYGTKYVFGYTGGAIMPFFDELQQNFPGIKPIKVRHEQGAAFAAQGYARATGKIGFVATTSGPGATNTVTGVADAMMDSVPIFVITGQVPTSVVGTDAFQESDMVGIMYPITKQAVMPYSTDELAEKFFELTQIATQGRPGPVHLDLPKDIQLDTSEKTTYKPTNKREYYPTEKVSQTTYDNAIALINKAKRPIVFCGHGVILANAGKAFTDFVEKCNIPFSTTLHGISAVPSDHPLNLGMMGMHGTVAANRAITSSDLIISLGMRFDDRVTAKLSEYARNAQTIHVEIDASEIRKIVKTNIPINDDVKTAIKKFLSGAKRLPRKEWFSEIERNKQTWTKFISKQIRKGTGPNGRLLMKTVISRLSEITKGQDNIVADVGQNQMMSARFYNYQRFNTHFSSGGLGTMGFSLPTAIGVKIARPKERVWAICGDGGLQMNIQELGTILEHKLDIDIILLNNGVLGMVRQWQSLFFGKRYAETDLTNPDFMKIAEAYGMPSRRVEKVTEIDSAIRWAMENKGPTLTEFVCDKDELIMPMIPAGATFEEMIETDNDINF
ncbi:biosynthetic-type acetolactate synthase large subunit [Candidatus Dojkabacteria bacterium]|nr:biosynthetic-type acetolactate synthase large subunit [Candidatus Dojkabacteria bacterium]